MASQPHPNKQLKPAKAPDNGRQGRKKRSVKDRNPSMVTK